jgi:hypothetical protein
VRLNNDGLRMNGTPTTFQPEQSLGVTGAIGVPGMGGPDQYPPFGETPEAPEPDALDTVEDSTLLQIMQSAYSRSQTARETRKRLNRKNWDAFHGKFDFLAKKRPGQSMIVIPSLETSMEQVCATLSEQLVGSANWFSAKYENNVPPMPGLSADQAAKILRIELERLAVDGGCMPTTYGMGRLIYDSVKIGLIESEVTWKISMQPEETPTYEMAPGGQMVVGTKEAMRLRIDLIPFEDHFPDPSPARHYNIHEIEVAIADLPDLGFTDEEIDKMRNASPGTEKLEERRRREGVAQTIPNPLHRVILREYWGDLVHPQTGKMIEKQCMFITVANTSVVRRPVRIRDIFWHGLRPIISRPLIPTPSAEQHHAFLDIAVPLVEAECELFNLIVDAGFNAALGVKEVRSYMLTDPTVVAKGITAGMELEVADGRGDGDVIKRADTGTLSQEMLTVFDRQSRTRTEALRITDPQLGRFAPRKTSATELNQVQESSDDLFSNIALRFEDTQVEPALELCWLTLWQFADEAMVNRIGPIVSPENAQSLAMLTPQERFVAFANAVSFKAQGYKYQLSSTKDIQTIMQLYQMGMQNPALMEVLQNEVSPIKTYKMILRAKGLDPEDLRPDVGEMPLNPMLLANQSGGQNPATNPVAPEQGQVNPPNATGERGIQAP